MNANRIRLMAEVTLSGALPFPEIVANLLSEGVESYHVDYACLRLTCYGEGGGVVAAPLTFEGLPPITETLHLAELKSAILDSLQRGQKFRSGLARC